MNKQIASIISALMIAATFVAGTAGAGEQQILKTQDDKVNYAIGVNIISNMKQQGVDLDLDLVIKGMRDAQAGGKLLLTEEELHTALSQYMSVMRQKRAQAMAKEAEDNKKASAAFLAENAKKDGVVTLPDGLQYKILKAGTGKKPSDTDVIECRYRGFLMNGNEFENSQGTKALTVFKVNTVIPGMREGLKLMSAGAAWKLFIPPSLAYGERGKGGAIGPNVALIYEVELIAVK
jgi:FKBP-type peptidyl-prolyl cis-trans isomerase